jgi:hypothetical protein
VLRQQLSILLASDQRPQHAASTQFERVTRHGCQLDVRILKHLLSAVDNAIPFAK